MVVDDIKQQSLLCPKLTVQHKTASVRNVVNFEITLQAIKMF